ncbi:archease [archaeon]|nr:archease [archaeon]
MYKFIKHTADIQFQIEGKSIEEIFLDSASALMNSICKEKIKSKIKKEIAVEGHDFESLLYNFLEEILFLFDSEQFLISKIEKIKIDKFKLKCVLFGDKGNYEIISHVKAVTYNEMYVKKEKSSWKAQVTLDV